MIKREEIQYRVSRFSDKTKYTTFLVYIDARTATRELDEKWGKDAWSFTWSKVDGEKWAVRGVLKIGDFIREDVGYPAESKKMVDPSSTQWLKDAVSDALKRCAVQAGVGRELYDAPLLITNEVETYIDKYGKTKFKGLNQIGKQLIEGNIDKWYDKVFNSKKDKHGKAQ